MDLYTKEGTFDANMFELFNVTDLLSTNNKGILQTLVIDLVYLVRTN